MIKRRSFGTHPRRDFSKIPPFIEVPYLLGIQTSSYDRFLQRGVPPVRAREPRAGGRLPQRLPDPGLQGDRGAGVRALHHRGAEVLGGRVPRAGHDPLRAAQGHDPARALPEGRRRQEDRQGHEGAGGLLRRAAPHDPDGDVHHQRHRARRGEPDAQVPRRLLRQREEQDRPRGAHPLRGAHDPVPRLLAGLRVRRQGLPLRADRPAPQVPRHDLPPGDGLHAPGDSGHLLPARDRDPGRERRVHQAARPGAAPGSQAPARHRPPEDGRGARQGGAQAHRSPAQEAQGERRRGDSRSPPRSWPDRSPPARSRTRRPARCCSRATWRSARATSRRSARRASRQFELLAIDGLHTTSHLRDTLEADGIRSTAEALVEIYKKMRPGRAADPRDLPGVLREPVLQPEALRPLARRPDEAHHEALAPGQGRPRRARSDPRRHHRDRCAG